MPPSSVANKSLGDPRLLIEVQVYTEVQVYQKKNIAQDIRMWKWRSLWHTRRKKNYQCCKAGICLEFAMEEKSGQTQPNLEEVNHLRRRGYQSDKGAVKESCPDRSSQERCGSGPVLLWELTGIKLKKKQDSSLHSVVVGFFFTLVILFNCLNCKFLLIKAKRETAQWPVRLTNASVHLGDSYQIHYVNFHSILQTKNLFTSDGNIFLWSQSKYFIDQSFESTRNTCLCCVFFLNMYIDLNKKFFMLAFKTGY